MTKSPTKLLRLKGAQVLEAELRQKVRALISQDSGNEDLLKKQLEQKSTGMKYHDYWRFRVLHRQFEGQPTPGFPLLVRAARFVVKRIRLGMK